MKRHNPDGVSAVPESFRGIYAHVVETGPSRRTVYLSGQIGLRPDGTLADGFDGQCRQAMANVETLLAATGLALRHVAKVTYLLTRAVDLGALGGIRRERWAGDEPPAVTTFVVAALARPELLVEIDVIAVEEDR